MSKCVLSTKKNVLSYHGNDSYSTVGAISRTAGFMGQFIFGLFVSHCPYITICRSPRHQKQLDLMSVS